MKRTLVMGAACVVMLLATAVQARVGIIRPPERPPGPGWVRVWVPPVYETIVERVWIEQRTEMRAERVWVPDAYEWCDGRYVLIKPGHWQIVYREVVIPGHYENVTRRVLVREGYWKWVRVEEPPPPIPMPQPVLRDPPTVGVEGYSSGPAEDLSKFSPLTEWPK